MRKLADCQPVLLQKDTDEKTLNQNTRCEKEHWSRHQNNGEVAKEHEGTRDVWVCAAESFNTQLVYILVKTC